MKTTTLSIAVLLLSGAATAATIKVPQQQPTIQAAVDAASPGDTILVKKGTYKESVDINMRSDLLIKADGKVILDAEFDFGSVFHVRNGTVDTEIRGFTIRNSSNWGIRITDGIRVTVSKCVISNTAEDGLYSALGDEILVSGCEFFETGFGNTDEESRNGVLFEDTDDSRIEKCTFHDIDGDAIDLDEASFFNKVVDNDIEDCRWGIRARGNDSLFKGNSIQDAVSSGFEIEGLDNDFEKNAVIGSGDDAFSVYGRFNRITKNTAKSSRDDAFQVGDEECTLTGNKAVKPRDDGFAIESGLTTLEGNKATKPGDDGFHVESADNFLKGNTSSKAGDNGFEMRDGSNTVTKNTAAKSGLYDLLDLTKPNANDYSKNSFKKVLDLDL